MFYAESDGECDEHPPSVRRIERRANIQDQVGQQMKLNTTFSSKLFKSPNRGGWTYALWPDSVSFFGTKGLVKVQGTIDGLHFHSSFMAMGGGVHMLPIKSEVRTKIGKEVGEMVTIHLQERIM